MKKFISFCFIVSFLLSSFMAAATDYYAIANGEAGNKLIWNSSRDGQGIAPANFNEPADNFIIQDKFHITNNTANFSCKGSLIIENGGVFTTGNSGKTTSVNTAVSINPGGILKLQPKTSLLAGFVLIQGTLENHGTITTSF